MPAALPPAVDATCCSAAASAAASAARLPERFLCVDCAGNGSAAAPTATLPPPSPTLLDVTLDVRCPLLWRAESTLGNLQEDRPCSAASTLPAEREAYLLLPRCERDPRRLAYGDRVRL